LFFCCARATAGPGQAPSAEVARVKALFDAQLWAEIVRAVSAPSADSADLNYYYGIAAAQLGDWPMARAALLAGMRLAPSDPRFSAELGGVAFREKRYEEAASWLRKSLHLDGNDEYVSNFLATIYFLNGNLEAAVKYWNRNGRPEISDIRTNMLRV